MKLLDFFLSKELRTARIVTEREEKRERESLLKKIKDQQKSHEELDEAARVVLANVFKRDALPKFQVEMSAMDVVLGPVVVMAAEVVSAKVLADEKTVRACGYPMTVLDLNLGEYVTSLPMFLTCPEVQEGSVVMFDRCGIVREVMPLEKMMRFERVPTRDELKRTFGFPADPRKNSGVPE